MRPRSAFKRVPLWGKAASLIALAAGIAAAVAGSGIMGDNLVKVQDPVIVASVAARSTAGTLTGVTYNDDLSFEVTAETYPGDSYDLEIEVTNLTDVDQTHRLSLVYPDGFRFSRDATVQGSGMVLTQESPSAFVFTVDSDTTAKMIIHVEVLPQVLPGWYTVSGATEALAADLSNVG